MSADEPKVEDRHRQFEASFGPLYERHAPDRWREIYAVENWAEFRARQERNEFEIVIMVADIRQSTLMQLETRNLAVYAHALTLFVNRFKQTLQSQGAWFDKFTGDGFIAYWLLPKGGLVEEVGAATPNSMSVLVAATALHQVFETRVLPILREDSRNFPGGAGLAIGLDQGDCAIYSVADDVTLLGPAVVGATRMVEAARARETIVNVTMGVAMVNDAEELAKYGVLINREVRATKEFPANMGGQEVYSLTLPLIEDLTRTAAEDAGSSPTDTSPVLDP